MFSIEKIEEWIREVEVRPASAPAIIRSIANRLRDFAIRNEALLDENIQLRSRQKVEAYEEQIANLEYQLDLLKRQLNSQVAFTNREESISLLVYNVNSRVLKINLDLSAWDSRSAAACFQEDTFQGGPATHLLLTSEQEELLFLFDSGRTARLPVSAIPEVDPQNLEWQQGLLLEPHSGEELAAIVPIAKMSLFEFCIQTSRRGFLKKIVETFFEMHLAKDYIGSGVKQQLDRTCNLTLCNKGDRFVMVSKEGVLLSVEVDLVPLTIEEGVRLEATDHIVSAFCWAQKPSILIVTQNGKGIHREAGWLELASSLKTRGQPILSKGRRASGVRVIGAAPVDENDLGAAIRSDGKIITFPVSELVARGSLLEEEPELEILSFAAISRPVKPGSERRG